MSAHVVVPGREGLDPETAVASDQEAAAHAHEDPATTLTAAAARSRWARLLARIYEVFPLRCPECGSHMRILAFLTDPEPTGAILRHLELPHTPPRVSPARGPPQPAFDLDADPVSPTRDPLRSAYSTGERPKSSRHFTSAPASRSMPVTRTASVSARGRVA